MQFIEQNYLQSNARTNCVDESTGILSNLFFLRRCLLSTLFLREIFDLCRREVRVIVLGRRRRHLVALLRKCQNQK